MIQVCGFRPYGSDMVYASSTGLGQDLCFTGYGIIDFCDGCTGLEWFRTCWFCVVEVLKKKVMVAGFTVGYEVLVYEMTG